MTGHLIVTDEGAARMIKLRRPEKKNAITQDMYRGMSEAIDTAQNNPDIRCIIVTGGSGVFTAGNDLEDFLKEGTSNADAPRASGDEDHFAVERRVACRHASERYRIVRPAGTRQPGHVA